MLDSPVPAAPVTAVEAGPGDGPFGVVMGEDDVGEVSSMGT